MQKRYFAPLLVFVLALSFAARADQDDIDNNADLQPTPEEKARTAVLRRWPDATDVDAYDMAGDDDAADMDDAGNEKDMDHADEVAQAGQPGDDDDAEDELGAEWTVSVMFTSAGKHFEALVNDDGKIQYVYETIPLEDAPKDIVAAARAAVKEGDVLFCQRLSDESEEIVVHSYVVGVGQKDVSVDVDGTILKVKDAPAEDQDVEEEDNNKLRI
jgi:hypothetical protein